MKLCRRTQPCRADLNLKGLNSPDQFPCGELFVPHRHPCLDSLGLVSGEDVDRFGASLGPACVSVIRVTCDS